MASTSTSTSSTAGTSGSTSAAKSGDQDLKFTITVNCTLDGERRAVSYTVFKRTLISQVFDSSVQFFGLDPAQVVLVVKSRVALHHKCVEDYRLGDKSFLDLVHIKEVRGVLHLQGFVLPWYLT